MSVGGVLLALARGPKTTSELLATTGRCSGDIARTCAGLIKDGRVKRIDGTSGRGSRAIYALTGYTGAAPAMPERGRLYAAETSPPHPGTIVDREPCFKCGVRADVGCRHNHSAAHRTTGVGSPACLHASVQPGRCNGNPPPIARPGAPAAFGFERHGREVARG